MLPPKKILFKHSPLVERPQSYPRVIIVWKLASACLQDLSTPHLCLRIPRRKSAAWSSRRFCSLALIFRPYIAFHVQQFPQTYPAAPPTSSSCPSPPTPRLHHFFLRTYGDQVIFAGASNKCIHRRYERGRKGDVWIYLQHRRRNAAPIQAVSFSIVHSRYQSRSGGNGGNGGGTVLGKGHSAAFALSLAHRVQSICSANEIQFWATAWPDRNGGGNTSHFQKCPITATASSR